MMKTLLLPFSLLLSFAACTPGEQTGRSRSVGSVANNSPSTVSPGFGRILEDNPIILSKNGALAATFDVGSLLRKDQQFISNTPYLKTDCSSPDGLYTVSDCYRVLENATALPLTSVNGKWAFTPNSRAFWQVHTFGHMKRGIDKFHSELSSAYNLSQSLGATYKTTLAANLYSNHAFWGDDTLTAYAFCDNISNAYFEPSTFQLCFGVDPINTGLLFVQDPTIIYHELGHALIYTMMNQRNLASTAPVITKRTDLGSLGYDEGAAINEGLADYNSFVMNGRTHMGEWALGRFFHQSRAMDEDDAIYGPGISTSKHYRLSYPQYLNFDPNHPTAVLEDIHYAGQIASHYLVALTKDLKSLCSQSHTQATANVRFLLAQTLGELGDLTSKASQNFTEDHNVNLIDDNDAALEWTRIAYPPNYRRFFQIFAKHLVQVFTTTNGCSTGALTQNRVEQLLDEYGLLLFKTYNDNGNGYKVGAVTQPGFAAPLTSVSPANRDLSVLIPKSLISFDPTPNAPKAFVIDNAEQIASIVASLKASGQAFNFSPSIPSDLRYNNNNGKINPNEIVGVALNLYNRSGNSPMGGVQILANDWDHAKMSDGYLKMCPNFEDQFPLLSENAADLIGDSATTAGDCRHITKENGGEAAEYLAPVCFVQHRDTNEAKWVSQDKFRALNNYSASSCLDPSNTQNCFIRAVKGADHAYLSRIDAGKTFLNTLNQGSSTTPTFQASNLLLFEVSENIPSGTTFDCRLRVRFTNCDDCYHDPNKTNFDDYLDFEYAGDRPFKILNLQFTVTQ